MESWAIGDLETRRGWWRAIAVALMVGLPPAEAADPPAPIKSPGGVRTGIFGLQARGNRFVYVFDRSASMGEPEGIPLAAAKQALLSSLEELGDVQQFYVIFYNDRLQVFSPAGTRGRLVFATEQNRREARRFIDAVKAAGGTRHEEALAAAFRLDPDVVFLLTDADAKDDLTAEGLERLSKMGSGSRCMVVQFGDPSARSPRLQELATRCGGRYVTLSPNADPTGTPP